MQDLERSDPTEASPIEPPDDLRETAIKRLKKRSDFRAHLLVYLLVNAFLWGIWVLGDAGGFPWPAFVSGGWGIGLLMDAWETYGRKPVTEQDVQAEIRRLEGRR